MTYSLDAIDLAREALVAPYELRDARKCVGRARCECLHAPVVELALVATQLRVPDAAPRLTAEDRDRRRTASRAQINERRLLDAARRRRMARSSVEIASRELRVPTGIRDGSPPTRGVCAPENERRQRSGEQDRGEGATAPREHLALRSVARRQSSDAGHRLRRAHALTERRTPGCLRRISSRGRSRACTGARSSPRIRAESKHRPEGSLRGRDRPSTSLAGP